MTEHHEHDDAEQEAVRRLLADVRHTEPMPADVVARMDAVLQGLAPDQEQLAPEHLAPVVPLPPHRRRAAAALLAAAAVIVVGGVTFATVHYQSGTGSSETAGAAPADANADRGTDQRGEDYASSGNSGTSSDSGGARAGGTSGVVPQSGALAALPVRVRAHHFTSDAARARKVVPAAARLDSLQRSELIPCHPGAVGRGVRVPASYDGSQALLVYRSPAGGSQVVDLYLCGARSPVRSTTLPQAP